MGRPMYAAGGVRSLDIRRPRRGIVFTITTSVAPGRKDSYEAMAPSEPPRTRRPNFRVPASIWAK